MRSIDKRYFEVPPFEYRPIVFWSWNELMEPDELRRQLREMHSAGFGGGFIHSRIGLLTEYLSEDWFKAVDAVIDESKKLGFKVYLYDEDKWPSGFAGGIVPLKDKEYRLKALVARKTSEQVPDYFEKIAEKDGLNIYKWIAPIGHCWFNGTCYADLLSEDAMKCFIEESYESYYKRYQKHYGELIVSQFTDEPAMMFRGRIPQGAVPYTNAIEERFEQMHGYCPRDHFHLLFTEGAAECEKQQALKFRIQYFRTINDLFETNFSKQIGQWCEDHNISFTGHYMMEGSIYDQQCWSGKVMPQYRHLHEPGIDHLGRQIDEMISGKQCQSIVNQYGKKRMLSEMYGCSGQALSFEDRLWIATQQIQLGVNLMTPHLCSYTMSGCRKRDYPPNLYYQQPWWSQNAEIDIPLSRLCWAMSRGQYQTEILVIHPQESTFALWLSRTENCCNDINKTIDFPGWDMRPTVEENTNKILKIEKDVCDLVKLLNNSALTFDFGDETVIASDASVNTGKISVGKMDYSVAVLPSLYTIAETTVDVLNDFIAGGGVVLQYGDAPEYMDGIKSEKLTELLSKVKSVTNAELINDLSKYNAVTLSGKPENVYVHSRKIDDTQDMVLVSNLNRKGFYNGTISIDGEYSGVKLLDHWTGDVKDVAIRYSAGKTSVDITLAPVQSLLLMFGIENKEAKCITLKTGIFDIEELCDADFEVTRLDDNALLLDKAYWALNDGKFSKDQTPIIALQEMLNFERYEGRLDLKYTFQAQGIDSDCPMYLVMEHPEYYDVLVNGSKIETGNEPWVDMRFIKHNISGKLIDGTNTVHLACRDFMYGDKAKYEDYFGRYGTEIESVYIVGDFAVNGHFTEKSGNIDYWKKWGLESDLKYLCHDGIVMTSSCQPRFNHLAQSGLPFYAGRIEYKTVLPETDDMNVLLSFDKLGAPCAEVFINGTRVGSVLTSPYRIDISEHYAPGAELSIVLHSSLRNLLGPHHNIEGEVLWVSPDTFAPQFNQGTCGENVRLWLDGKVESKDWSQDYCIVDFGNIGKVSLLRNSDKTDDKCIQHRSSADKTAKKQMVGVC